MGGNSHFLRGASLPLSLFLLWLVGDQLAWWPLYVVPSPQAVGSAFFSLWASGDLMKHITVSFFRVFAGFMLAFTGAISLAVLLALKPIWRSYTTALLEFIRHVPPLAALPMLILWFGIGEMPKILIVILATFFPIFLNTLQGFLQCDPKLQEVGKTYQFNEWECFYHITLPAALPAILLGMQLGLGYSWRALIGAELIAASSGIGYLILDAEQLARPDIVVIGIVTIGLIGSLIDWIFFYITRKLIPWAQGGESDYGRR
ncbi:MAG: ABC transporter permease [Sporomusaceae bacterium]|nr:ABC transporter permease [Sporomusaceae bacterium]